MRGAANRRRRYGRAFLSLFRIKAAEGLQYRVAALAGAATSVFWCLIEITVYTVFFTYGSRAALPETAGGMTLPQMVTYAWLAQLLFLMQPMSIDGDIQRKIESGDVGIELCRPLPLYLHWLAKSAAARLTPLIWRGSAVLLAGLLMPAAYRLGPPASLTGFLCALLSAGSAFLLCSAFAGLIAAVRLNVTWGNGPTFTLMLLSSVLSGAYLPLQLWPDFLQGFLLFQPFAGYLDIPLRLYLGAMAPAALPGALLLQLAWTAAFLAGGWLLTEKRLRNIVVQGG